jgi:hypothetical protein
MRNNQRGNNQTNQDCVGENMHVCPTIANSVGIGKQTEFLDSQLTEKVQIVNLRQHKKIVNVQSKIVNYQLPCPVRDSMFVEKNMNAIFQPCRQVRNVTVGFYHNHIAYLRHAVIGDTSLFYKHDVPNGTLPTNKIISFYRGTKTSFRPNFNNKTTSVAKEINIDFNLITSLQIREIKINYELRITKNELRKINYGK